LLHLPIPPEFWTFTSGSCGNAGPQGNMALTCRYFQSGVSLTNWGAENIAATVSSAEKSTSGFARSKPFGQSVRRTSRMMETAFLSHPHAAQPRSSQLTDPQSFSIQRPPPSVKRRVRLAFDLVDIAFTKPRTLCVSYHEL